MLIRGFRIELWGLKIIDNIKLPKLVSYLEFAIGDVPAYLVSFSRCIIRLNRTAGTPCPYFDFVSIEEEQEPGKWGHISGSSTILTTFLKF